MSLQSGTATLNYDLLINSLSRTRGASYGGFMLTIYGAGFPSSPDSVNIQLCGKNAKIITITNIATTIIVPACTASVQSLTYSFNGITKSTQFTYETPSTSSIINSISPITASPVKKGLLTISGSGFGSNVSLIIVYLANSTTKIYQLKVMSVNDSVITCGLSGGLPGNYFVQVTIADIGDIPIASTSTNLFSYKLSVISINPTTGGYNGGTLITITGTNFSPDAN